LAELQQRVAGAVLTGEADTLAGALVGGAEPRQRLAIHQRHYEASLTAALSEKFPASAWLVGADVVRDAARAYVRAYPPRRPCIAEYGDDFPEFLATHGRAAALPYLASFAALEWAVGQTSIAIDSPPLAWPDLATLGQERLLDTALRLQPGVRHLRSSWRVDELMTMYLRGTETERFELSPEATFIEVRGARGALQVARLDAASFEFRAALANGRTIGDAAVCALDRNASFDAGEALRQLVQAGLVSAALDRAPGDAK
jgi:hypothetical protein